MVVVAVVQAEAFVFVLHASVDRFSTGRGLDVLPVERVESFLAGGVLPRISQHPVCTHTESRNAPLRRGGLRRDAGRDQGANSANMRVVCPFRSSVLAALWFCLGHPDGP